MAQAGGPNQNPSNDRRRVKVYELRDGDWYDRGTGFCRADFMVENGPEKSDPRVIVQSEDQPGRILLETKIVVGDRFAKQQDTLIVWTEPDIKLDLALSFQEAEGCLAVWRFINNIQTTLGGTGGTGTEEDSISDDLVPEAMIPTSLPSPSLGNLHELEAQMRVLSSTTVGREALTKLIIGENYIRRMVPLVEMAEDMEDLTSLHRLCTIMKTVILLNDNAIIEHIVTDEVVLGVVGALEYDPDFPSHKANHRHWLGREGRYKEVVRICDENVLRKIHHTYRLQYLKDVVLARILDDPTFSVLNGLIFFNQVEIVQHLQTNTAFLKELFGVFGPQETDQERKKAAVLFIQQCCAIAKNLQQPARQTLYNNFLGHGLLSVINFALRHNDVVVRVGATDVLVSMIDHDPQMIRQTIFRQMNEKQTPLTDSLIDLLLVEADLGVKAQIADAIKVLLDPGNHPGPVEGLSKANGEFGARLRPLTDPQHELFLNHFYEESAKKLFKPLVDLKGREDMNFTVHQVSLFIYLIEILCFFIRQHMHRSKYFVLSEGLAQRISQLLGSPEKYLKLTALKFFRNLVGLQDEFYNQQMMQDHLFEPVLDLVIETMPRDNLLNSACLEFFEFIKNQGSSQRVLITHLVENYRDKFETITYVDTFRNFLQRYDDSQGFASSIETSFLETEDEEPKRPEAGKGSRWGSGIRDLDADEEAYFNTSDDEEEKSQVDRNLTNGASPVSKLLVDYPSDEENENIDNEVSVGITSAPLSQSPSPKSLGSKDSSGDERVMTPTSPTPGPPERLSEKRRREEDEEDEIGKLSNHKRRSSISSTASNSSMIRRKHNFNKTRDGGTGPKKIAISLSPAIKTGGDSPGGSAS